MAPRLEVIVGPMFSGKTELLISRLHRVLYARKRLRIIKPAHDTRTQGFIASRAVNPDGTTEITDKLSAQMVRDAAEFNRSSPPQETITTCWRWTRRSSFPSTNP